MTTSVLVFCCTGPSTSTTPDSCFSLVCCAGSKEIPQDFRQQLSSRSCSDSKIETAVNERALLNLLMSRLHRLDPDVILGHNIRGFDLDVLMRRMEHNKVEVWSKVSMVVLSGWPGWSGWSGWSDWSGLLFWLTHAREVLCNLICHVDLLYQTHM